MINKSYAKVFLIVFLGGLFFTVGISQNTQDPGVMLRSAIEKEEVDGDLQGAIDIYQAIIQKFSSNKAIAAQAQLRIGLCYEKLGKKSIKQALQAFQMVIDNYPTQSKEVKTARERLSTLVRARTAPVDKGLSVTDLDFYIPGYSMEAFDLSPDGTKMLGVEFDKGQNIVVCDLKNQKVKFITDYDWSGNSSWTYNPIWSPDGKEIAYNANKKGPNGRSLMIATLDGRSRVLVSNEKYWFFPNAWLPDGSAIVTMRGEYKDNTQELGLVPIEDGEFKKLISLHGNVATSGSSRAHACVSPDGRFIAYTDKVPGGNKKDIFVMSSDGKTSWPLLDHPAGAKLPRWSPDGKHIAFLSLRHGSWALWGVKVEKGKAAGDPFLIREGMQDSNLQNWSSHGLVSVRWIGIRDIYLMDIDPKTGEPLGNPSQLNYIPTGGNRFPVWSPDGKYLAFLRKDPNFGKRYISVLSADGSSSQEFPVPKGYGRGYLRWKPDGSGIGMIGLDFEWNNFILHLDIATKQWKNIQIPVQGSWARFEWSGNGKAFFYSKNGMPEQGAGIYERNLETGAERLIYHNPDSRVNFRWLKCSRDYKWLAFVESNTKNMVVNLETGESHLAASRQGFCSWSSDGQKMLGLRAYGESEGYKKALRVFSASGGSVKEFELSKGLPERGRFSAPDWSPDGKQVVFGLTQGKSDVLLYKNIIPNEKK